MTDFKDEGTNGKVVPRVHGSKPRTLAGRGSTWCVSKHLLPRTTRRATSRRRQGHSGHLPDPRHHCSIVGTILVDAWAWMRGLIEHCLDRFAQTCRPRSAALHFNRGDGEAICSVPLVPLCYTSSSGLLAELAEHLVHQVVDLVTAEHHVCITTLHDHPSNPSHCFFDFIRRRYGVCLGVQVWKCVH